MSVKQVMILALILLISAVVVHAGQGDETVRDDVGEPPVKGLLKIADKLRSPEGPAWNGKDTLYVSNCGGDWITKVGPQGAEVFLRSSTDPFTFEKTNGMTVYRDGSLFACDFGRGAILKISPDGKSEIYASGYQGQRFRSPNDLAFNSAGDLYFTDPHNSQRENPDGTVYRVTVKTREVQPVAMKLGYPNGIAFSPDEKWLYVCESTFQRILRFPVQSNGKLGTPEVFANLPEGNPDGINFDRAGNLYVALLGSGAVHVLAPDGSLKKKIPMPGKDPSNVDFGGNNLRTLFVTEFEMNAVYQLEVDIPGMRLFSSPTLDGRPIQQ